MSFGGFAMMAKKSFDENRKLRNRRKNFKEQKRDLNFKNIQEVDIKEEYKFLDKVDIRAERKAFIRRDDRVYYVIMLVMFLSSIWFVMNYGGF